MRTHCYGEFFTPILVNRGVHRYESVKKIPTTVMLTVEDRQQDIKSVIMESIAINITLAEVWRKSNLNPIMYYNWKQKLIEGVRMVLSGSSKDNIDKDLETENERLKSITVEQTIAIDAFKKTLEIERKV